MTLILHGHPFSSYTWKALIALYANGTAFDFDVFKPGDPDNAALLDRAIRPANSPCCSMAKPR